MRDASHASQDAIETFSCPVMRAKHHASVGTGQPKVASAAKALRDPSHAIACFLRATQPKVAQHSVASASEAREKHAIASCDACEASRISWYGSRRKKVYRR